MRPLSKHAFNSESACFTEYLIGVRRVTQVRIWLCLYLQISDQKRIIPKKEKNNMAEEKTIKQRVHSNNWLLKLFFVVLVSSHFVVGESRQYRTYYTDVNTDPTTVECAEQFNPPKAFRLFDGDAGLKHTKLSKPYSARFNSPPPYGHPFVLSNRLTMSLLKINPGYSPTQFIISALNKQHVQNNSSKDKPPAQFS